MYLGIDYGKTKIGLALSEGITASPIGAISNAPSRIIQLKEKITEQITHIVIGLPNSPLDAEIKKFAEELKNEFNCEIVYEDETNSTNQALEIMIQSGISKKKRQNDDAQSAATILQQYLDRLQTQQ